MTNTKMKVILKAKSKMERFKKTVNGLNLLNIYAKTLSKLLDRVVNTSLLDQKSFLKHNSGRMIKDSVSVFSRSKNLRSSCY